MEKSKPNVDKSILQSNLENTHQAISRQIAETNAVLSNNELYVGKVMRGELVDFDPALFNSDLKISETPANAKMINFHLRMSSSKRVYSDDSRINRTPKQISESLFEVAKPTPHESLYGLWACTIALFSVQSILRENPDIILFGNITTSSFANFLVSRLGFQRNMPDENDVYAQTKYLLSEQFQEQGNLTLAKIAPKINITLAHPETLDYSLIHPKPKTPHQR